MFSMENNSILPDSVKASLSLIIYEKKYGTNILQHKAITEKELLTAIDVLTPYFPLSDDEENSVLSLSLWLEAYSLYNDTKQSFDRIVRVHESTYEISRQAVREYEELRRYRLKGQNREYHKGFDERLRHVYEELMHKSRGLFKQIPYDDFVDMVNEISYLREIHPHMSFSLPQVQLKKEFVTLEERLNMQKSKVDALSESKAKAVHILKKYLYEIVKSENIMPINDAEKT